jgi:hypothetical protein
LTLAQSVEELCWKSFPVNIELVFEHGHDQDKRMWANLYFMPETPAPKQANHFSLVRQLVLLPAARPSAASQLMGGFRGADPTASQLAGDSAPRGCSTS